MSKFPVVKNVENIAKFIECISFVTCTRCGVKETIALDTEEAAEQFVITGRWVATAKNAYCPQCAKKYIK